MLLSLRNQKGDTIVEVLIVVAIISLIVTGAYAVSNKNTQAIQDNAERVQAQHLVEAQLEALRATNGAGLTAVDVCYNGVVADSACNAFQQTGSGAIYKLKITKGLSNVYKVVATWTSIGGKSTDDSNVTMVYRLQ